MHGEGTVPGSAALGFILVWRTGNTLLKSPAMKQSSAETKAARPLGKVPRKPRQARREVQPGWPPGKASNNAWRGFSRGLWKAIFGTPH
jgi:hypothetical protein